MLRTQSVPRAPSGASGVRLSASTEMPVTGWWNTPSFAPPQRPPGASTRVAIFSQLSVSPSRYCWKVCPVASVTRSVTNAPSGQLASNDTPRAVGRSGRAKFAAT